MSKAAKGKYVGEKNPMYGRRGENSPLYGRHHSQETKDKMSKARKGTKHPGAKAVLKLDEFGNIVTEYGTMKDCQKQENISRGILIEIIEKKTLYNGFYFEYKSKS